MVDPDNVRPTDLKFLLVDNSFYLRLRRWWRRWRPVLRFVRQKGKWHTKDIHVLRLEESLLFVEFIGDPTEPSAHNLFAKQLAGEGAQPHDMGHGPGIPSF